MKKIKVCLIGNLQSPHNLKLAEVLAHKKQLKIYFITPFEKKYPGIKTYYIPFKSSSNLLKTFINHYKFVVKAKNIIQKIQPDIVHGQSLNFYGIWAYLTGFRPLVVTLWGSDVNNYEKYIWLEKYLIKKTLKKSDLILTNSLVGSGEKAVKIGADRKKIKLMQFGINLNTFKPTGKSILREKLNLQNKKVVFCPRAIQPIYNIDILIKAFEKLAQKRNDLILALFEPDKDLYGKSINKLLGSLNLKEKVVFLPKTDNKNMVQYYLLADIVIILTSSEGCSSCFMEAMAMEKKIVLTNLPVLREWPGNYWKVPVRNIEITAQKIDESLRTINFKNSGRRNRDLIRKNGEITENFMRLENYYRELVVNKL